MQNIQQLTGTGMPLLLDDIDTDRIIPARYLRCISFDGLGEHAFEDDRKQNPDHPFNDPQFRNGAILVTGRNFGCGSSREHAPQSLIRWGIKAIVGESFAEIFFGNCTSLGVPAVCVDRSSLEKLGSAIQQNSDLEITVDLIAKEVRFRDQTASCEIAESARNALITGQWDFLSQLLQTEDQIRETASKLPYMANFS